MTTSSDIDRLRTEFQSELDGVQGDRDLKKLHDRYLGRKRGAVVALLKSVASAPPDQRRALGIAIAIAGGGAPEHWSAPARPVDLFDIKGLVERTCEALGAIPLFERTVSRVLVTGRASSVTGISRSTGEQVSLGIFGQLTPTIATNRGFPNTGDEVYVAELDLVALAAVAADRNRLHATPVPRYPSVVRDLALIVDGTLPAAAVRDTIQTAAPDTLVSVREFDRYVGPGVPDGYVSLALRLTFRASDRTLTALEVQAAVDAVVAALRDQHGATLR